MKKFLVPKIVTSLGMAAVISQSVYAVDFSNWFDNKPKNTVQENSANQPQQAPSQNTQRNSDLRPAQLPAKTAELPKVPNINQGYSNSNKQTSNDERADSSGLETRMSNMANTVEGVNNLNRKYANNALANDYLAVVQMIIINESTKTLDGMDNSKLINSMVANVYACQAKLNNNITQTVNNDLSRSAYASIQNYLSMNNNAISNSAGKCIY